MSWLYWAVVVVAVVSLLTAGWLRAAGSALARLPRADALRDASDDVAGAELVAELLDERERITPAVAVVGSGLLVLAAGSAVSLLASGREVGSAVFGSLLVSLAIFIVGDLAPRQLGRRRPRFFAYRSARLLDIAMRLGGWASDLIADANGEAGEEPEAEEGEGAEQEREMIDSVLEFAETVVREVMTPRPDMVTVPVDATIDDVIEITTQEGYSRIPVTSDGDVVGMVIVKDLLPLLNGGDRPESVAAIMRPVEFVPETKLVPALLAEMQAGHVHQMIVVDEYGDVAGLVTIEDLLEELVGEIADETDEEETFLTARPDGGWDVDARLPVDELAEAAGVPIPDEDWDTVGGLVMGLAERVPDEGETFHYGSLSLTVTRMQGRRVAEVHASVAESIDAG